MANNLVVEYWGDEIPYSDGIAKMHSDAEAIRSNYLLPEKLIFLQHRSTITTTKKGGHSFVRAGKEALEECGITLVETDRGGDVTFHGPGQLVGYPLIRLNKIADPSSTYAYDLHGYLRSLEKALLESCRELGVADASLLPGFTGIWVGTKTPKPRKLIAIGIGVKGGISRHGFALNIDNDYRRFLRLITPCGLDDKGVTNLREELETLGKKTPPLKLIKTILANKIKRHLEV